MEEKLSMRDIIEIIKKRVGLILLITFAVVTLAGVISYYFMTPVYQSTTQILVSQEMAGQEGVSERDVQADLQLVATYTDIIESPVIMGKVIEQLNLNATIEELKNQISINSNSDSQLIEISVKDENQRKSIDIANTTANVFQEEIKNILNANNLKILFPAEISNDAAPVSPSPLFNMAIGVALGLMLGIGIACLLSYFDTSIKNDKDVEKYLGVPVLAAISPVEESIKDEETRKVILQEKEV